jgi:hypothetical protein
VWMNGSAGSIDKGIARCPPAGEAAGGEGCDERDVGSAAGEPLGAGEPDRSSSRSTLSG